MKKQWTSMRNKAVKYSSNTDGDGFRNKGWVVVVVNGVKDGELRLGVIG